MRHRESWAIWPRPVYQYTARPRGPEYSTVSTQATFIMPPRKALWRRRSWITQAAQARDITAQTASTGQVNH